MQILQPFAGSIQQYAQEIADPDRYRPDPYPQCQSQHSLIAHGFYRRTLVDAGFDDAIRVRRYLCRSCKRTVSLLPQFALPYLRFSIPVIAPFLVARLLQGATLAAAAVAAAQSAVPCQRGQFWIRRFQRQAAALCAALAALTPPAPAANFIQRVLEMLQSVGWIAAHRFLFSDLRFHLLGWPASLAPDGRCAALRPAALPARRSPHSFCMEPAMPSALWPARIAPAFLSLLRAVCWSASSNCPFRSSSPG